MSIRQQIIETELNVKFENGIKSQLPMNKQATIEQASGIETIQLKCSHLPSDQPASRQLKKGQLSEMSPIIEDAANHPECCNPTEITTSLSKYLPIIKNIRRSSKMHSIIDHAADQR